MCFNPKFCWWPNLSFFGLGPWIMVSPNWQMLLSIEIWFLITPFELFFPSFQKIIKKIDIGSTEFKLWQLIESTFIVPLTQCENLERNQPDLSTISKILGIWLHYSPNTINSHEHVSLIVSQWGNPPPSCQWGRSKLVPSFYTPDLIWIAPGYLTPAAAGLVGSGFVAAILWTGVYSQSHRISTRGVFCVGGVMFSIKLQYVYIAHRRPLVHPPHTHSRSRFVDPCHPRALPVSLQDGLSSCLYWPPWRVRTPQSCSPWLAASSGSPTQPR